MGLVDELGSMQKQNGFRLHIGLDSLLDIVLTSKFSPIYISTKIVVGPIGSNPDQIKSNWD